MIRLSVFLSFITASLPAQEDVSCSKWQANKIIIDGNDTEWKQPFGLFDNKSRLVFALTNDNKNIYLCFTDNEEMKAEKLMKAGWTLAFVFSLASHN